MIGNAGSGRCWKDGRSCCSGSLGFSGFAIAGTCGSNGNSGFGKVGNSVLATLVTEGEGVQAQEQVVILVLEKLGWWVEGAILVLEVEGTLAHLKDGERQLHCSH